MREKKTFRRDGEGRSLSTLKHKSDESEYKSHAQYLGKNFQAEEKASAKTLRQDQLLPPSSNTCTFCNIYTCMCMCILYFSILKHDNDIISYFMSVILNCTIFEVFLILIQLGKTFMNLAECANVPRTSVNGAS